MKQAQWPVISKTQIGTTAKEEEEESTNHFPTKRTRSIGGKRLLGNVPLATNAVTRPMVRLERKQTDSWEKRTRRFIGFGFGFTSTCHTRRGTDSPALTLPLTFFTPSHPSISTTTRRDTINDSEYPSSEAYTCITPRLWVNELRMC